MTTLKLVLMFSLSMAMNNALAATTQNVRVWDTEKNPRFFPELHDKEIRPDYLRTRLKGKKGECSESEWANGATECQPHFGVAFSGGGTRSASATLGQLRALRMLGWLDQAAYISAVSGGSWASTPFVFLPESNKATYPGCLLLSNSEEQADCQYLAPTYLAPGDLADSYLKFDQEGSLAHSIAHSRVMGKFIRHGLFFSGDETYSRAISDIFLKPVGLGDRSKYPTFSEKSKQGNNDQNQYYVARYGRPYLVLGGTIIPHEKSEHDQFYPFELTGDYVGARKLFKAEDDKSTLRYYGGGYVENIGYDSTPRLVSEPSNTLTVVTSSKRHILTLGDYLGTSGAAPVATLQQMGWDNAGFPEFLHYPIDSTAVHGWWKNSTAVASQETEVERKARETLHGDGGHMDNFGLMQLLARKVQNILVFINTQTPFCKDKDAESCAKVPIVSNGKYDIKANSEKLLDDLVILFNMQFKEGGNHDNKILAEKELNNIISAFTEQKRRNLPLVYCGNYKITKKGDTADSVDKYLIEDYDTNICWVYLDRNENYIDQVKKNTMLSQKFRDNLEGKEGEFKDFPNYKTFLENASIIDLSPEQVNLLGNFTTWSLLRCGETIEKHLNLTQLPIPPVADKDGYRSCEVSMVKK